MDVVRTSAGVRELDVGENCTSAADLRLLCMESLTPRQATLCCHDKRVLKQLLHIDYRHVISSNPYVNGNITDSMRTKLAEWIYEVTTLHRQNDIANASLSLLLSNIT